MVDQARGEHYSVHAVEGTGKHSSILQFRSAHDDGDSKGTSDGRTSGCPATGHTLHATEQNTPQFGNTAATTTTTNKHHDENGYDDSDSDKDYGSNSCSGSARR